MSNPVYSIYTRIKENISKVIVGKGEVIDLMLIALFCRGHMLIEDVPGTGKTMLVKSLAASIDCEAAINLRPTFCRPTLRASTF